MKHLLRLTVIVAAVMALIGCVQTDVTINLNHDGSGTVVETVTMSKAVTHQMRSTMESMQQQEGGEEGGEEAGPVELWPEEDIRAQAENMGEGVKFESMELIDNGEFDGYRATYSFTDINKLMVNQNPGGNVPAQEGQEGQQENKPEHIMFSMEKGSPSTLTIRQPKEAEKSKADAEAENPEMDEAQKEMMMSMMKMMLEGMKISIAVQVPGEVVSTNASYQDGARITLMEMDFDQLIASEEHWEQFTQNKPETVEDTKKLMKSIPGMKVELEKEVKVSFE